MKGVPSYTSGYSVKLFLIAIILWKVVKN
jgi:hypothetical protein